MVRKWSWHSEAPGGGWKVNSHCSRGLKVRQCPRGPEGHRGGAQRTVDDLGEVAG